ncbi:MAG: hypothetical protein V5B44_00080 [Candidatus Accumulibacter necessarius]|jgi:hypothetical protein|uniref:hypothetical protein n=1 Tax=Candidatus Accumulibacter necessarius TaxID=2954386 RepID=UPI002FC2A03E
MDTDWIPHGTIKRMLTAEQITDRILGVSKTATVSTRTLFLGSGNNVGPIRDLLRRVLTIHIDPRCATPATMTYKGFPVDKVRQRRGLCGGGADHHPGMAQGRDARARRTALSPSAARGRTIAGIR